MQVHDEENAENTCIYPSCHGGKNLLVRNQMVRAAARTYETRCGNKGTLLGSGELGFLFFKLSPVPQTNSFPYKSQLILHGARFTKWCFVGIFLPKKQIVSRRTHNVRALADW